MESEQAPGIQDTPEVAGPEGTAEVEQQQPTTDWQERYTSLQPEYTRATQEAAQLRQERELYQQLLYGDPDTRREAADALGIEIDEDDPAPQSGDPYEQLRAELDQIKGTLSARDQQAQQEAQAAQVRAVVDERLNNLGVDQADQDHVLAYAIHALPATPEGLPDVEGALKALQQRDLSAQKRWADERKRAPRVPVGQSATEAPDHSTHEGRLATMLQRARDLELEG